MDIRNACEKSSIGRAFRCNRHEDKFYVARENGDYCTKYAHMECCDVLPSEYMDNYDWKPIEQKDLDIIKKSSIIELIIKKICPPKFQRGE